MTSPRSGTQSEQPPLRGAARSLGRGLLALVASRFITTPIAIAVNALLVRYLGASDFGDIYLANTALGLAFLFVEFGTASQTSNEVARDHSAAGRTLTGGAVVRLAFGVPVLLAIPWACQRLGYSEGVQLVFLLTGLRSLVGSLAAQAAAVVRGLELLSVHATRSVQTALLDGLVLVPVLLLGGGLRGVLWAQVATAAVGLLLWLQVLTKAGVRRAGPDRETIKALLTGGVAFVAFDVVLRLQPYIDASWLKSLGTTEEIGWYAAATRLVGALTTPASLVAFAIYPTLARLWATDRPEYDRLVRVSLRAMILFGSCAGVGTVAFAGSVTKILYGPAFWPAAADLQLLAPFILLLYGSMMLGSAIFAAQKQLVWAGVQALCIPVSLIADPLLIRLFQSRSGNGGLGVCVSLGLAEAVMLAGGLVLIPKGILDRSLLRELGRGVAAGAVMAGAAYALRMLPWVGLPVSVLAYVGAQAALGGLTRDLVGQLRSIASAKLGRAAAAAD